MGECVRLAFARPRSERSATVGDQRRTIFVRPTEKPGDLEECDNLPHSRGREDVLPLRPTQKGDAMASTASHD